MNAKVVLFGLLAAAGLGFLLTRTAQAQPAPAPEPTPLPLPVNPPAPTPVPIPPPPPPEAVLPSRYMPAPGISLRNDEYLPRVVVSPQGIPMDTNWTLTLRVYDWTKPGTPVFEIARILRWTAGAAPPPSEWLEIYKHEARFWASDFTMVLEGSGGPFYLVFLSDVGRDRMFPFEAPAIYKRALRTTYWG